MSLEKTDDMVTSEKHIDAAVSEQSKAGVLTNDLEGLTLSQILARLQASNEAPYADKDGSPIPRRFANPAPLGLGAFALTSFISSVINVRAHSNITPDVVVALAFCYGGLVQLLAGMWEMALGNTFSATSFSSYGAFWISFSFISLLERFQTLGNLKSDITQSQTSMGLFLMAWFIFTTILLLCTLKSNLALFFLFFFLDLNYLLLAIAHLEPDPNGNIRTPLQRAGGVFGLLAAAAAWYNALAGLMNASNSFFTVPVAHFPWSRAGHCHRAKSDAKMV
ncbi:hypothetical protein N7474_008956 [Penicillium riverlandense]|uniref:uncharacterized protein n=1 Tax=Penicillium riverlandense TaxID=1903569 RepID=UPI002548D620|nr:uncharacterized protein N7474_008956 [Penicillium riverlandense]KAJ5812655.1 hypothetical protein N7474_008956 [Penicillium riverlandense]